MNFLVPVDYLSTAPDGFLAGLWHFLQFFCVFYVKLINLKTNIIL